MAGRNVLKVQKVRFIDGSRCVLGPRRSPGTTLAGFFQGFQQHRTDGSLLSFHGHESVDTPKFIIAATEHATQTNSAPLEFSEAPEPGKSR